MNEFISQTINVLAWNKSQLDRCHELDAHNRRRLTDNIRALEHQIQMAEWSRFREAKGF